MIPMAEDIARVIAHKIGGHAEHLPYQDAAREILALFAPPEDEAARAALSVRRSGWLPIASAPKDGTRIDLLYPYPRGRAINCYWHGRNGFGWVWREPTWENGELLPESKWGIGNYPNMQPTHWQPLPQEPSP